MKIFLFIIAAVVAYLVTGLNTSITFAKFFYHDDIRAHGSGNPGFTNFRRIYGKKYSWAIFAIDIGKAAVMCLLFGILIRSLGSNTGAYSKQDMYQIGAAFAGVFCMLGNLFPVWYEFKGGKGYLVSLTVLLCVSPVAAIIGFLVMCVLLITTNYMSLSTMTGNLVGVILLCCLPIAGGVHPIACIMCVLCVVMMIIRHSQNIVRLLEHTESKSDFTLIDKINALKAKFSGKKA